MVDGIAEHRIGPNDLLHITVWNGLAVEETTVRVAEDGTIFVPFGIDLNLKALAARGGVRFLSSGGTHRWKQRRGR